MASLQSRLLAEAGCMVLQTDLYGCGDSDGDFADARWEIWKSDIQVARRWLKSAQPGPISLWGVRLAASLAAECAAESTEAYGPLLLWQPVVSGELFLTQFLRQRIANEMLNGGGRNSTKALRAQLAGGDSIEVSGYMLTPQLAAAIDGVKLTKSARAGGQVHWWEVIGEMAQEASPAAQRAKDELCRQGMEVTLHTVRGEPFWGTVEIAECPGLLEATLDVVTKCR
jgi:exosortase A-associated hydrolase 2